MNNLFASLRFLAIAACLAGPAHSIADTIAGTINTGSVGNLAVDPATNRIFASQGTNLVLVEGSTHEFSSVPVDGIAGSIAVNSVTGKIYVVDNQNDRVVVVDGATFAKTLVAVGDGPTGIAVNAATNKVYIANSTAGSVTVIDGSTHQTTTVTVGANPLRIAINTATNRIYVANSGGTSLSMIDGATLAVTNVPVGAAPLVVAVDPVLNKVYVTHSEGSGISNRVTVVDGVTHATTVVPTALYSNEIAVNPASHKVYVGARGQNGLEGKITVIDGQTLATAVLDSGEQCCRVAVNATSDKAYGAASGSSCSICPPSFTGPMLVIDGATDAELQRFAQTGGNSLAVNPVTNRIYATYFFQGSAGFTSAGIRVFDGAANTTTTAAGGTSPAAVATNPATNRVYVANNPGGSVTVLDGTSGATLTTVTVGAVPSAIAVNPATNKIYVANYGSSTVTVIDGPTNGTTTVAVGTQPTALAVNAVTNRIYVANIGSDNVTVIDGATQATITIAAGLDPVAVAVDPTTDRALVVNNMSGSVTIIDGATNATTTVTVGTNPVAVVVDPLLGRGYVANSGSNTVTVIHGPSEHGTHAPGENTNTVAVTTPAIAIAVNPVTHKVYALSANGTVSVIDALTEAVTPLTVPADAFSIAVNPAVNKIYIGRSTGTSISVIDGITHTVSSVTAGTGPHRLAVNLATDKIHVANAGNVTVITDSTRQALAPITTIGPLAGNRTANPTPTFTLTVSSGLNGAPVQAVFFQVDTYQGAWSRATGSGSSFSAKVTNLKPGTHVLYAFAADANVARGNSLVVGQMAAYVFTLSAECFSTTCSDVSVVHSTVPGQAFTGKDALYILRATNAGPYDASFLTLSNTLPASSSFVWATPGCAHASGTVTCDIGSLAVGASTNITIVVRPSAGGTATSTANVSAAQFDSDSTNNQSVAGFPVSTSPAASHVLRYRLYSDVTKEHHFTTDLNEYTVLGGNGNWVQEGTVGRVLNNPGSFNGVAAVPYYRMYNTSNQWHHWTTDPNEYYTLIQFSNWNAEGVDGYILPTQASGSIPLYRLLYPFIPGLHHWTVDANEYSTLIGTYGWIGEGGTGYVLQE